MLKKINPFKKKAETVSTNDIHQQAIVVLSNIKSCEQRNQNYVRIKILNGYILVAEEKYRRKKRYYQTMFGTHNIL